LLGLLACLPALAAEKPVRIVSANLCADRLLVALVEKERIVSLSRYASDPSLSTVTDKISGIPLNRGDAEEIAAMNPDLVLVGVFTARASADMLQSLGVPVYRVGVPLSLAEMRKGIRDLAARVGESERGEALIANLDQSMAQLPPVSHPARVAFYAAGGWSQGSGTIADEILHQLGAINVAAEAGIKGGGNLTLESLISTRPDLVVVETGGDKQPSMQTQLLDHPLLSQQHQRRLNMPMQLWACADGSLAEAAQKIAGALQ
jgi:iron complex transport system substrate-binding protein